MKLNDYFRQFLSNVEPADARVKEASASHTAVRRYLETDPDFKDFFLDSFLAGSYARDTAYEPIQDVDIIVVCKWDGEPSKLLTKLKSVLDKHYNYKAKTNPQRRSVRIDLSHISMDIVPARHCSSGLAPLEVPDREQKKWVATNPKGHIEWVATLNKNTKQSESDQGRFVPLAKMFKYWKRNNLPDAKHPKGFWMECLVGWNHDPAARDWADVFINAVQRIIDTYAPYKKSGVPVLTDPGLRHQTLATGMEAADFQVFYTRLERSLADAKTARADETGVAESALLWQKVFGKKFPTKEQRDAYLKAEQAVAAASTTSLGTRSTRDVREPEQFGSGTP